ncbi:MAG: restriction endonuclease subunit S [Holosporaceae bacterium]|jgi:type I restriction enzyme S subunit|nr:restriction endonuclease subunit S [Holosporaceae bacterium]
MICVSEFELAIILDILRKHTPDYEVRAFGSRYKWTSKEYSDLDIAIVGKQKMDFSLLGDIRDSFEESDLPFRVDVLDWHSLTPEFQAVIEQGCEVIYNPKMNTGNTWTKVRLGDVCEFKNGKKRPKNTGIYPVYGGNGILDYTDEFNYKNVVIIGRVGAYCGNVCYEPQKAWVSDNAISAKNLKSSDMLFDYYLISQLNLNKRHIGTSQPLLTQDILNNIIVNLPPLPTQRAIAATLSCLDDKIELNRRINANLEAQAQAVFKSWFDSQTAKSWEYGKLSDIATITPQRNLKKGVYAPYLEMANLPTRGSFPSNWKTKEFLGGMKFKNGDTILARITPCLENGKTAYVNFMQEDEVGYGSTEYVILSAKDDYPNELLYFLARTEDFRHYAIKNMTGTSGRQRVSADVIGMYKIKIPSKSVIEKYRTLFSLYMSIIRENSFESRALAAIRDTLLPKLMSGELEVLI